MESGRIGPLRPLGCLAHIKGFAQRMAPAMPISPMLCQGSASVRLICPKKGYTLNLGPVIPLGWSKGSQVQALWGGPTLSR